MKIRTLVALATTISQSHFVMAQAQSCAALAAWDDGAHDVRIAEAEHYADRQLTSRFGPGQTLPPHCHVTGSFEHRTGSDGKAYAINFAVNLPDNWNGRYLFQGGG